MKQVLYWVFGDQKVEGKKIKPAKYGFCHMFPEKQQAREAIEEYRKDDKEREYQIVEGVIDVDDLTNMASCALTGNCYTNVEIEVINSWNY